MRTSPPRSPFRSFVDAIACTLLVVAATAPAALVVSAIVNEAQTPAVARPEPARCPTAGLC